MSRPRVIQELSSHLAGVLRAGLRDDARTEALFPVYWGHPCDFDAHPELSGVSPLVGMCLLEVLPEPGIRAARTTMPSRSTDDALLRSPAWITCRYLLSIRSDDPIEEQGLVAAAFQLLLDYPIVPVSAIQCLREEGLDLDALEGFPITLRSDRDLWQGLSLRRHRVLVVYDVSVPLASTRKESVMRVSGRQIRVDRAPWATEPMGGSSHER